MNIKNYSIRLFKFLSAQGLIKTYLITLFVTCSLITWGQTTVTIGNTSGGTTRNYPISPYYNYSYSQQIILQSEIATQGSIT
jgi:hypothetical protein